MDFSQVLRPVVSYSLRNDACFYFRQFQLLRCHRITESPRKVTGSGLLSALVFQHRFDTLRVHVLNWSMTIPKDDMMRAI